MIAPVTPPEPVFDAYCDWLTGIGGRVVPGRNRHGGYKVLHSPGNALCVVIPDSLLNGLFVSTLIEYLDTRLGLHSPWNQMPVAEEEAAED